MLLRRLALFPELLVLAVEELPSLNSRGRGCRFFPVGERRDEATAASASCVTSCSSAASVTRFFARALPGEVGALRRRTRTDSRSVSEPSEVKEWRGFGEGVDLE